MVRAGQENGHKHSQVSFKWECQSPMLVLTVQKRYCPIYFFVHRCCLLLLLGLTSLLVAKFLSKDCLVCNHDFHPNFLLVHLCSPPSKYIVYSLQSPIPPTLPFTCLYSHKKDIKLCLVQVERWEVWCFEQHSCPSLLQ